MRRADDQSDGRNRCGCDYEGDPVSAAVNRSEAQASPLAWKAADDHYAINI